MGPAKAERSRFGVVARVPRKLATVDELPIERGRQESWRRGFLLDQSNIRRWLRRWRRHRRRPTRHERVRVDVGRVVKRPAVVAHALVELTVGSGMAGIPFAL